MSSSRSGLERLLRANIILLAFAFASFCVLVVTIPDEVVAFTERLGAHVGSFSPAPRTGFRLWLSLAASYMVLVTVLAVLIQRDLRKNRGLIVVLAIGKLSSSLTSLAFYMGSPEVFAYLLNFVVDGSIVLNLIIIWLAVTVTDPAALGPGTKARTILSALLHALLAESDQQDAGDSARFADFDGDVVRFFSDLGQPATLALLPVLYIVEYGALWWCRTLRPFTRLSQREQIEYLRGFGRNTSYTRQQLLFMLRFVGTMVFYSTDERARETGYTLPEIDRSSVGVF